MLRYAAVGKDKVTKVVEAVAFCRGRNIGTQRAMIKDYCAKNGTVIVEWYDDIEEIPYGATVVVTSVDRLTRNGEELVELIAERKIEIKWITE